MRKVVPLLLVILINSIFCFGQVSFTGSTDAISTDDDASPVVVDPNLTISHVNTDNLINGARVAIISNFTLGDQLDHTVSLPDGVSKSYSTQKDTLIFSGTTSISNYLTLLRSVTFTASASSAMDRMIEFNLGAAFHYTSKNHYYEYVTSGTDKSWTTAKNNAASMTYFGIKGYLVTITDVAENTFITKNIHNNSWIGASDGVSTVNEAIPETYPVSTNQWDAGIDGNFYWVTGPATERVRFYPYDGNSPINFFSWNPGEPGGGMSENFAQIKLESGSTSGKWEDMSNDGYGQVPGYIVEYGGLEENEPVLNLKHTRTIEVQPTVIITTASKIHYDGDGSRIVVDPYIEVKSGGLITDAKVIVSGNYDLIDYIDYVGSLPNGLQVNYNSATGTLSFTGTAKPSVWEDLFRRIRFLSHSSNHSERTLTFLLGSLTPQLNGHYYEYVSANASNWIVARDAAAARRFMGLEGYLATITSDAENALVANMISKDSWIGGSDEYSEVNAATSNTTDPQNYSIQSQSEGVFYWVTGPERGQRISTVTNYWHPGEPNNQFGNEHYIEMYSDESGARGKWNDYPNSALRTMVVEYGGMPTDPAVVISASRIITYDQVLPVRGLNLQLREKGNGVELQWTVLGEEDVKYYVVLHSINGSNFRKIGEVKATDKGSKIVYSFTDANALNGSNYYKILVVDEDGKQHYSDVRSIAITGKLQLYPTVITDHFTVNQPNATPCLLTLTDALGVRLLQKTIKQGINSIEVGFLTGGTYFVQISNGTNQPEVFKIIK